ncbi:MAG: hypothetical protein ACJ76H_11160 [Bacteriovoracaceae bacterium]
MKNSFLLVLTVLVCVSCGGKSRTKFYVAKEEDFSKFINNKAIPADPNLSIDKSIVNNDYPMQLALYKDGRFYYDLPTLSDGTGTGTWTYSAGQITLKSKHRLFDMRIDIHALDEAANNLGVTFIDRHGPQTLKMDNSHVE